MRRLGQYADGPNPNGLVLSLDPELSHARHLESSVQSSESYYFQDSEDTLEVVPMPPSSPPLMALALPSIGSIDKMEVDDDGGDTDVDEPISDQQVTFRAIRATSLNSSFAGGPRDGDPIKVIRDTIDHIGDTRLLSGLQPVDLSNFGMTELPTELFDIRNLVCIEDPRKEMVNLNLSNNLLKYIPEALYTVTNIRVLSLRHNQLKELSPLIGRLTNLTELTVSNNELTTLPLELWQRANTKILITALGNNFLPAPGTSSKTDDNGVPTLLELSQRALLVHPEAAKTCQRLLEGALPERLLVHIRSTFESLQCGRRCSKCFQPVVMPTVSHTSWHQSSGSLIPFRANFCSSKCHYEYFLDTGLAWR